MRTRLGIVLVVFGLISPLACGPSGGARTYPVTGTVTLGGSPIAEGSIVFDPADGQGTAAMGGIQDGQFTAMVPPGEKIIRISAVRTTDETDQYGGTVSESYIPAKYNTDSEIRRTVNPGEANKFDIALD
jgi:hypothetical protein